MNPPLSLCLVVVVTPRRAGLAAGQENMLDVLVRVQAPDAPAGHLSDRPPQALALVIDRSGSMQGRPLDEARRCGACVIEKLRPTDAISLVSFDHRVRRLWPATPVGDGVAPRQVLADIDSGGNTDLHGGWREGAETLTEASSMALKRVILLSDGQANEGVVDPQAIATACAQWAARGITTSTYGLGESFNEDLMVEMARAGGGNSYYGETAADLMEPFQQELDLLGNLCLHDLRITLSVPDGASARMLNPLPQTTEGWRLPDLAWGAEAWCVVRLTVPSSALPPQGHLFTLLRVSVSGRSVEGEAVQLERTGLSVPVLSKAAWQSLADDELVSRRLVELAAAQMMLEMRAAAAVGDWPEVDRLLAAATLQFAGNSWVAAVLESMQTVAASRQRERVMKEMRYSSEKLNYRLSAKDEQVRFSLAENATAPAYLRRKPAQGKADV